MRVWPVDGPDRALRAWFVVAVVASICCLASVLFGGFLTGIALASTTVAAMGAVRSAERWRTWKAIALDLSRQLAERTAIEHREERGT